MLVLYFIIALTVAVSIASSSDAKLWSRLAHHPVTVKRGQYDRLVGYGFVHDGAMHLAFNMLTLYFFGGRAVLIFGPLGFAIFYLLGLIISALPSQLKYQKDASYISVGASGAVAACVFVSILVAPWHLLYLYFIPMPAIVFGIGYLAYGIYRQRQNRPHDRINHSAHIAGALWGIVATIGVNWAVLPHFIRALLHPSIL